jgi:peptide/nickel transport system substrate-binding protein
LSLNDVNVKKPSEEVISFSLETPFSPFPSVISQPILKKITTGRFAKKTQIIGLEEYRITEINTYNGIITSLTLESELKKIHYSFFPTEKDAVTAFKLGKVDKLENLNTNPLPDWPRTESEFAYQSDRYLALFFNTADSLLQDKSVRQLLAYATPKTSESHRVISPISTDSWAYNPQVKPYDYNPETAQATLEKLKTNNPNLSLDLVITTTPAYEEMAQKISTSWQQLGINSAVKVVAFPDTSDYQILLIGQQIPSDPDQYALWHSTQSSNITKYKSPKVDKLLEDGRQEQNREVRKQIYQDFQRFLVEDAPAVFLEKLPMFQIHRLNH